MAVGNIVGLEPIGPQAYNFVDKTGAKKTLFGPDAENLAQQFRKSEELARGTKPTAMNGGAPGVNESDLVVPPGGFGGFGGQVPQPEVKSDVPVPVPGVEGPPASIAREQAPQQQPGPRALYAGSKPGETIIQNPDGTVIVETRSAPTKGGMVEKSRTEKGGFDPNQGYIDASIGAFKEQQGAEEVGAASAVQQANAERSFLEEQQRQAAATAEQQAQQIETIKRGVADKQVAYDIAQAKYNNYSEIDQDRIWERKGTGARILSVVGAALGAFGSAITKTPNFALQIVDGMIERDIRSQERQIAINRESAQNALSDLVRQTGSLDLAKTALGAIQTQRMQLKIQQMANAAKTPAAIAQFQKANALLTQSYADKLEEYRQKATGEVSRSIVNMPGSAGGVSQRLATVQEAQSLKNLHKSDAPRKDPGAVKEERELAVQGENINFMEDRLKRYEEDDVPLLDQNRWIGGRARVAVQDFLMGGGSSARTMGEDERALVQDYESVKNTIQGVMAKASGMGTAMSDSERAVVTQGLAPGSSVGSVRRALAAAREINQRTQSVIKEFGPVPAQEIPTRPVE